MIKIEGGSAALAWHTEANEAIINSDKTIVHINLAVLFIQAILSVLNSVKTAAFA
jgi:hypothetical protein